MISIAQNEFGINRAPTPDKEKPRSGGQLPHSEDVQNQNSRSRTLASGRRPMSEAPDTFKGFVLVNPSIPEAWEPPTDDEPKERSRTVLSGHIWRPHPPPDFLIEDFAKYSRHVDEVWASLPPAPERPPSVPKAPRQPAADPEKIEKAKRENKTHSRPLARRVQRRLSMRQGGQGSRRQRPRARRLSQGLSRLAARTPQCMVRGFQPRIHREAAP